MWQGSLASRTLRSGELFVDRVVSLGGFRQSTGPTARALSVWAAIGYMNPKIEKRSSVIRSGGKADN